MTVIEANHYCCFHRLLLGDHAVLMAVLAGAETRWIPMIFFLVVVATLWTHC